MTEKAAQLQSYNQDLVKCKILENVYAIFFLFVLDRCHVKDFFISPDIEVLKRKKMKTEIDIATDEKNKETIANQIKILNGKLEEIEARQQMKIRSLAKIEDTLQQSEIGEMSLPAKLFQAINIHSNLLQVTQRLSTHFKSCSVSPPQRLNPRAMLTINNLNVYFTF